MGRLGSGPRVGEGGGVTSGFFSVAWLSPGGEELSEGSNLLESYATIFSCCRVMLCISAANVVVRCLSVTFVYCVEAAKDTAIVKWCAKPYTSFRMLPFSKTLSDNLGFRDTPLFNVECLRNGKR